MNEPKLEAAIAYFEDAIRESDEIIADCTPALQTELAEQRGHFVVALEAMRAPLPDNKALTVEELREMDGEPVWVEWAPGFAHGDLGCYLVELTHQGGEAVCRHTRGTVHGIDILFLSDYGKYWLAYRRPPEKGE